MEISWLQAIILGIFACLASMPGMGGTVIGNYTLGRPLVGGLVCGIVLGDIQSGILIGTAMQVVYIALVTPGGTVSADVRAVSYIGIPLAMIAVKSLGLDPASPAGIGLATSFGSMVGTLGTVLFYGTATINLAWQHIGWKAVEEGNFHKLYFVDMGLPWISHIICSFIPTVVMCLYGQDAVEAIKTYLDNYAVSLQSILDVISSDEYNNLLSVDNYKNDGPSFVISINYIENTKRSFNENIDMLILNSDKDNISNYIYTYNI